VIPALGFFLGGLVSIMRKVALFPLAFLSLLFFTAEVAVACTCKGVRLSTKEAVRQERDNSYAVFSGTVTEVDRAGKVLPMKVTFEVERAWKNVDAGEVMIGTAPWGGACGYPFEVGERYLVYAGGTDGKNLWVSTCSRTGEFGESGEDLKVLGAGKKPRSPGGERNAMRAAKPN
jgi:hypothetical protein